MNNDQTITPWTRRQWIGALAALAFCLGAPVAIILHHEIQASQEERAFRAAIREMQSIHQARR